MKGKLYTSYFAKIKKGKGVKISIARILPKWLNKKDIDYSLVSLAPPIDLLNDYKYKGLSWEEYTNRYISYIASGLIKWDTNIRKEFKLIEDILNNDKDVTIYCYEKSGSNCHRYLLADFFRRLGFEVIEIE